MTLKNIEKLINAKLAGELLTYTELKPYLDNVIDDINQQLNSKYPTFSELDSSINTYDFFPDSYIRSVVVPGATWYYYVMDEEGMQTAPQFQADYQRGLFYMLRDFLQQVPEEYQQESTQGSIVFDFEHTMGTRGLRIGTFEGVE